MIRVLFAALVALVLVPAQPQATILWHGGELPDFVCTGTCGTIAGSVFRANFARLAVRVNQTTGDPATNRLATATFTGSSTIWFHFQLTNASAATTSNIQIFRFIDNAGNPALVVRGTGTNNQFKVSSRTSGGVFTDLVTCTMGNPTTTLAQYDIKIVFSGAGEITAYQDSVQQCTYSGDTTNGDGATTITKVDTFNSWTSGLISGNYSEIIIADEDTRAMSRLTTYPLASGNATAWTNSTGTTPCTTTIMAQTSVDDTKYVYAGSSALKEQCTIFNTFPSGAWDVKSLSLSIRGLKGAGGPQNITPVLRIGSTDYDLTPDWAPTTSFANGMYIKQDTSPATSSAFTQGELTGTFNIGFKSAP